MELTGLVARLAGRRDRVIRLFEHGQAVTRTFDDLRAAVEAALADLDRWGVQPGMRVGLLAPNSYAYMAYDLALIERRAISIAFTDESQATSSADLFEQYALSLLLVSSQELSRRAGDALPIAALDEPSRSGAIRARDLAGRDVDPDFRQPFLIFSSGSSGGLKGLVLDRRGVELTIETFVDAIDPGTDDRLLLFLPMSNFQQRMMYYAALWFGIDVIVTDPPHLFRALKEMQPTLLIAPPALYEAIENRVSNLPAWKQRAVTIAGGVLRHVPGEAVRTAIARRLFREVHDTFGGRMRVMITGMAPIKRSTLELFERLRLPLHETYGLIEFGSVSLNTPKTRRLGTAGRVLPGVRVELAGDGEIIAFREPTQAAGYFACAPGEDERTFLGGHRIATGDIGRFDADGFLCLVGRKKEIIVTSGGEKVHPERLEADIDACPDVAKSVVFSQPGTGTLTAVVLPTRPDDESAKARIRAFIDSLADRHRLAWVEDVLFVDTPFSRENGFLRPNLKLDRQRIARHFGALSRHSHTAKAAADGGRALEYSR